MKVFVGSSDPQRWEQWRIATVMVAVATIAVIIVVMANYGNSSWLTKVMIMAATTNYSYESTDDLPRVKIAGTTSYGTDNSDDDQSGETSYDN